MTSRTAAAAAVLACGLLAAGSGVAGLVMVSHTGHRAVLPGPPVAIPAPAGHVAGPQGAAGPQGTAAERPVSLVIPAIGVQTRLIRLGVAPGGGLQVPATTAVAGWYTGSPPPGAVGSAVIAGHIDSYTGPGVFFRLRQLRLITCGGAFDQALRSYLSNIVVYAAAAAR